VRNLGKIAENYRKGYMKWDVIPLLPFQLITLTRNVENLFWIIKICRIIRGFEYFVPSKIVDFFKKKHMRNVLSENEELFDNWIQNGENDDVIKNTDYTRIK